MSSSDYGPLDISEILSFVAEIMSAGLFFDSAEEEELKVTYLGALSLGAARSPDSINVDYWHSNDVRTSYAMSISSAFFVSLVLGLVVYRCRRVTPRHQTRENIFDEETWTAHPSSRQKLKRFSHMEEQDSCHLWEGGIFHTMFFATARSHATSAAGSIFEESDMSIEAMSDMGGSSILGLRSMASIALGERHRIQARVEYLENGPLEEHGDSSSVTSELGVLGCQEPEENQISPSEGMHVKWLHGWMKKEGKDISGIYT